MLKTGVEIQIIGCIIEMVSFLYFGKQIVNNFRFYILFISIVLSPVYLLSQAKITDGFVFDRASGESLVGANVMIMDSDFGASTDNDGYFRLVLKS